MGPGLTPTMISSGFRAQRTAQCPVAIRSEVIANSSPVILIVGNITFLKSTHKRTISQNDAILFVIAEVCSRRHRIIEYYNHSSICAACEVRGLVFVPDPMGNCPSGNEVADSASAT